jgi:hypothetical protein
MSCVNRIKPLYSSAMYRLQAIELFLLASLSLAGLLLRR